MYVIFVIFFMMQNITNPYKRKYFNYKYHRRKHILKFHILWETENDG